MTLTISVFSSLIRWCPWKSLSGHTCFPTPNGCQGRNKSGESRDWQGENKRRRSSERQQRDASLVTRNILYDSLKYRDSSSEMISLSRFPLHITTAYPCCCPSLDLKRHSLDTFIPLQTYRNRTIKKQRDQQPTVRSLSCSLMLGLFSSLPAAKPTMLVSLWCLDCLH